MSAFTDWLTKAESYISQASTHVPNIITGLQSALAVAKIVEPIVTPIILTLSPAAAPIVLGAEAIQGLAEKGLGGLAVPLTNLANSSTPMEAVTNTAAAATAIQSLIDESKTAQ